MNKMMKRDLAIAYQLSFGPLRGHRGDSARASVRCDPHFRGHLTHAVGAEHVRVTDVPVDSVSQIGAGWAESGTVLFAWDEVWAHAGNSFPAGSLVTVEVMFLKRTAGCYLVLVGAALVPRSKP